MDYFNRISSLFELVARKVIWHLNSYTVEQLSSLPIAIKDAIRVRTLRRLSNLFDHQFSALLHAKVQSVVLSFIKEVNHEHIKALEKSPNVALLNLSNLNIQKCVPSNEVQMPPCCIHCESFSEQLKTTISYLTSLIRLDLSYAKTIVDDKLILAVSENCRNLQQLDLDSCYEVTDISIASYKNLSEKNENLICGLVNLTELQCLGLSGTSVSDEGLIKFARLSKSRSSLKELTAPCTKKGV